MEPFLTCAVISPVRVCMFGPSTVLPQPSQMSSAGVPYTDSAAFSPHRVQRMRSGT